MKKLDLKELGARAGSIEAELALKINEAITVLDCLLKNIRTDYVEELEENPFNTKPPCEKYVPNEYGDFCMNCEWIKSHHKSIYQNHTKDSLGCNTLPEEKPEDYAKKCPYRIEDCPIDYPKHNHENNVSSTGCGECQKKEKELFDMVYQWGKVGIVTDEKCNAFQDLLKEIKSL